MAAIRLVRPLEILANDADAALERLLAATRNGTVSSIALPDHGLLRVLRRRDVPRSRECVLTWEPVAANRCTFIGSMSIVDGAAGDASLVLEGIDARLDQASAEAIGRDVLDYVAAELTARGAVRRLMRNAAPMLHAASAKRAKMG